MAKSRYYLLRTIVDGKDFKKRYPVFPKVTSQELRSDSDFFITWDDTKRVDAVAYDYLGSGEYWWVICLLNDIDLAFGRIEIGRKIRIPSDLSYIFNVLETKAVNV